MKKILIVDDDYHMRACINVVFRKAGFITVEVADGIGAIKKLEGTKIDAVILDHDMPIMTGIEALKEFKRIAPEVPVVMFTGSNDEALGEAAIRAGASAFIRKPAENEVIIAAVKKAMGIPCMLMSQNTA